MTTVRWDALKKTADDATRPVDDGVYLVTVDKAEHATATTGSEMIKATLAVVSGPRQGRRLFTNIVFAPDNDFALSRFFTSLAAFGIDDEFFAGIQQQNLDVPASLQLMAQAIIGRQANATVGTRVWQGQPRNEVKALEPVAGGGSVNVPLGGNATGLPPGVVIPSAAGAGSVPPVPVSTAPPVTTPVTTPPATQEVTTPPPGVPTF